MKQYFKNWFRKNEQFLTTLLMVITLGLIPFVYLFFRFMFRYIISIILIVFIFYKIFF